MASGLRIGRTVVTKALRNEPIKGVVYFLHGPCDNGADFQSWVNQTTNGTFGFKKYPVIYPSSPVLSYGLHSGKEETVWFNQTLLDLSFPEDSKTIEAVGEQLNELILDGQSRFGIPAENVIIGGFSMGGTMALHLGYKLNPQIGGVFTLSSFLSSESAVYQNLDKLSINSPDENAGQNLPKLFMSHGIGDPVIPFRWGRYTFKEIRKRGVDGQFCALTNLPHSVVKPQLGILHDWIESTLNAQIDKSK